MEQPAVEPRSSHTIAAAVVTFVLAVPFMWLAVDLAAVVFGGRALDPRTRSDLAAFDLSSVETGNLLAFGFWTVAIVVAFVVAVGIGILRLQEWARHAGILTFLFFGLLIIPMAIYGATYDPPSENAWLGLVVGAADLTVVGLLLSSPVSDDFQDAEWLRRYRERQADAGHRWRRFDRTG